MGSSSIARRHGRAASSRAKVSGRKRAASERPEVHHDRGAHVRAALIVHATRIFAAKGYAAASTREICQAAGANVAAIHYYFGDKEALYRAVLTAPVGALAEQFARFDDPALGFEQAMRHVLGPFVRMALDENPDSLHVQRLHLREALDPSAVFRDIVDRIILPLHEALAALLARNCGLDRPDEGIHQLAFAIVAMANDYCMSREFIRMLAPQVLEGVDAADRIVNRLVGYGAAMLEHEIAMRRRAASAVPCSTAAPSPAGRKAGS